MREYHIEGFGQIDCCTICGVGLQIRNIKWFLTFMALGVG